MSCSSLLFAASCSGNALASPREAHGSNACWGTGYFDSVFRQFLPHEFPGELQLLGHFRSFLNNFQAVNSLIVPNFDSIHRAILSKSLNIEKGSLSLKIMVF